MQSALVADGEFVFLEGPIARHSHGATSAFCYTRAHCTAQHTDCLGQGPRRKSTPLQARGRAVVRAAMDEGEW